MNMHIKHLFKDLSPNSVSDSTDTKVLWVPSEHIVVHAIPVPTAPKRKWPELVPWLLEDRLLQTVSEMHFVILGQNNDNNLEVAVVSKEAIREWLRQASEAQITGFDLIPDYLALPWQEGQICIAQRDEFLLVRSGHSTGFAARPALALAQIELLLLEAPLQIQLAQNLSLEKLPEPMRSQVESHSLVLDWHLALPFPAANLLSGEFRQKKIAKNAYKKWALAAILILGLGLTFSYLNTDIASSETSTTSSQQAIRPEATNSSPTIPLSTNRQNSVVSVNQAPVQQARIQINAELLGVVFNARSSSATIKIDGQAEKIFHLGDELSRGQEIISISPMHVVIEERGQQVELSLKKYDALLQTSSPNRVTDSSNQKGFSLANMFAAVPVQIDDFDTGLKLGSLSEEMRMLADIRDGDVVVQIGGNGIQELMSNPTLWSSYSTNTALPVTIIRDGQETVLTINAFTLSAQFLPNLASEFIQ